MSGVLKLVRAPRADYETETFSGERGKEFLKGHSRLKISSEVWQFHSEAMLAVTDFKNAESRILDVLRKLDDSKGFREFRCESLYAYAVDIMKLSENVTLNFIAVMRKGKQVPQLVEAIRDGRINISAARKIAPVIDLSNQDAWLELAANAPVHKIEKAVAAVSPKHAVQESCRYVTGERLQLTLGVSEEWRDLLVHLKSVVSQKVQRAVDTEEALQIAMKEYLSKHDPLEKARRSKSRAETKQILKSNLSANVHSSSTPPSESRQDPHVSQNFELTKSSEIRLTPDFASDSDSDLEPVSNDAGRQITKSQTQAENLRSHDEPKHVSRHVERKSPLSAAIKHAVVLRDGNQCTGRARDGSRCGEKRWLDIHHVIPRSKSGPDTVENLRMVCRFHHREIHGG